MIGPKDFPALSREKLLALVAELQRQITELHASHKPLCKEIDQHTRGGKRQAVLFAKGSRMAKPKSPGRRSAFGPLGYRKAPPRDDH